jgi:hypothetical protein
MKRSVDQRRQVEKVTVRVTAVELRRFLSNRGRRAQTEPYGKQQNRLSFHCSSLLKKCRDPEPN